MGSKAKAAGNQLSFQRSLDVDIDPLFVENTIIIQHDPDFQEAGDTARRLRCVWRQSLQKSVNAKMNQIYQPVSPVSTVQSNLVTTRQAILQILIKLSENMHWIFIFLLEIIIKTRKRDCNRTFEAIYPIEWVFLNVIGRHSWPRWFTNESTASFLFETEKGKGCIMLFRWLNKLNVGCERLL